MAVSATNVRPRIIALRHSAPIMSVRAHPRESSRKAAAKARFLFELSIQVLPVYTQRSCLYNDSGPSSWPSSKIGNPRFSGSFGFDSRGIARTDNNRALCAGSRMRSAHFGLRRQPWKKGSAAVDYSRQPLHLSVLSLGRRVIHPRRSFWPRCSRLSTWSHGAGLPG